MLNGLLGTSVFKLPDGRVSPHEKSTVPNICPWAELTRLIQTFRLPLA